MTEQAYFLTVDWCKEGRRGIFCNEDGHCFRKDDRPHTELEMIDILGPFWIILKQQSELLTIEEVAQFSHYTSLAEYSHQFGIARKPEALVREGAT